MSGSKYIGTPESWVKFISEWMKVKGRNTPEVIDADFKKIIDQFPISATSSYLHFYAAMEVLDWPDIFRIFGEVEDFGNFFEFLKPHAINTLVFYDEDYYESAKCFVHENVPMLVADANYKNYSREQDDLTSAPVMAGAYVIAQKNDVVFKNYLLLNPAVRSSDGEWEATYMDVNMPISLRFPSFAEMVVWFYLTDLSLYPDQNVKPWLGHTDDTTGLSRLLIED